MLIHPDLQPGEIIILKIDYNDGSEIKTRPALVISQNIVHQNSNGFVFLGITSKTPETYMISITNEHMENGSLNQKSSVIYDKPIWTEQTNIHKRIGKVKKEYFKKIMELLKKDILS